MENGIPCDFIGKMKFKLKLVEDLESDEIQEIIMNDGRVMKQIGKNSPKQVIVVPKKILMLYYKVQNKNKNNIIKL